MSTQSVAYILENSLSSDASYRHGKEVLQKLSVISLETTDSTIGTIVEYLKHKQYPEYVYAVMTFTNTSNKYQSLYDFETLYEIQVQLNAVNKQKHRLLTLLKNSSLSEADKTLVKTVINRPSSNNITKYENLFKKINVNATAQEQANLTFILRELTITLTNYQKCLHIRKPINKMILDRLILSVLLELTANDGGKYDDVISSFRSWEQVSNSRVPISNSDYLMAAIIDQLENLLALSYPAISITPKINTYI